MIGLPLRLLAREVYERVCARAGADKTALLTGEERIVPERAAYWICTVESMPVDRAVPVMADRVEVLPAPFGPSKATQLPSATDNPMPCTASIGPWVTLRS